MNTASGRVGVSPPFRAAARRLTEVRPTSIGVFVLGFMFVVPTFAAEPTASDLLREGEALIEQGAKVSLPPEHYARAEEILQRARALEPKSTPILESLASLYAKIGRSEECARLLRDALALKPQLPKAWATLGYVQRYAGHFEASIAAYRESAMVDASLDNRVSSDDQIAKNLIYRGDYAGALATHERMFELLWSGRREPDEKMLFYRGVAHLYAGHKADAVACFDASIARDAVSIWSKFGRAYRSIATGDRAQLEKLARDIDELNPVDGERHYRLVHFYAQLGDTSRALSHLRATLRNGFFAAPYLASDPLTKSIHSVREFGELLEQARQRHAAFTALAAPLR
jgi:tetratricopeptide (TPR) repeat protein